MKKLLTAVVVALASIAGNAQESWKVGNPNDPTHYGYLADYDNLKEYVQRDKYPVFKLGLALAVPEYNNGGTVKKLSVANFDEIVAGNAMKMASCVDNNGNMNFNTVSTFVTRASAAGHQVYGHTLAWHSQQPGGWLRKLIQDRPGEAIADADTTIMKPIANKDFRTSQSVGWTSDKTQYSYSITFDATNGMKVTCTKKASANYEVQYVAMENIPTEQNKTYKMTMTVRGSDEGSLVAKLGDFNSGPAKTIAFTKEWQDVEVEYTSTVANSFLLVQSGHFMGNIYIRNIQFAQPVQGKKMTDDTKAIIVKAAAKKADPWDNQFWLKLGNFTQGAKYEFTARVRADHSAKASTQIHNAPGSYVDWQAIGDIQFTSEWTDVKVSGTFAAAGQSIAFNLSEDANANTYYFANMSFKVGGTERLTNGNLEGTDMSAFVQKVDQGAVVTCETQSGFEYVQLPQPIPLSAQERHDTLVYAMDKWIKGMMTACKGKVKAWDLVNESISGGGADAEGVYALQHDNGSGDFFWQDYMGDLEYVRQAHRLARLYGPEDVKLFINDYNLESDWDNNGKLKSLIKWIERWEADGVTHIDGIGTQMHISCYANTTTQNSKKKGIENMLKIMAATGKYVRVSELDMGMVDASGNDVPTSKMTEAYHKKMSDLYKWIVQKYLEIVPVEQQWGICQWCATDSPSNSGWRADTPVGLWTLDYYRKHTYAGFAEGLGGIPSAIESVETDEVKLSDPRIYNLNGQMVGTDKSTLPAGLYIQNGKKFLKR